MRRLVTISYTPLDAGGGVPKFNRDLHLAFPDRECIHYSWQDFPWHPEVDARGETEWGRARTLNEYLVRSRKVTTDDVVIADGFWADGLDHLPLVVSHSHGIWSHLTHEDSLAGMQPDMPLHHFVQVEFRRRWISQGKHITAVSEFIAEQMRLQWGFVVDRVINNGVDTNIWHPIDRSLETKPELISIVHGVNDPSNENKGWAHIQLLHDQLPGALILSLDQASEQFSDRYKPSVLAHADIVVHPSGFEGNSMFVAEALACGVPVIGYDVGFLYTLRNGPLCSVMDRSKRSPEYTLETVQSMLSDRHRLERARGIARTIATQHLDISHFRQEWRSYVEEIENA